MPARRQVDPMRGRRGRARVRMDVERLADQRRRTPGETIEHDATPLAEQTRRLARIGHGWGGDWGCSRACSLSCRRGQTAAVGGQRALASRAAERQSNDPIQCASVRPTSTAGTATRGGRLASRLESASRQQRPAPLGRDAPHRTRTPYTHACRRPANTPMILTHRPSGRSEGARRGR